MCRGVAQPRGADDETVLFHAECRGTVRVQAGHEAQAAAVSNQFRRGGIRRQLPRAQQLVDTVQTLSIHDPGAARDVESEEPIRRSAIQH